MEDYKIRMIDEYRELKDRYEKLHKMIVKYEAGTLDFDPACSIGLLREQANTMEYYLHILEIRAEKEGIGYDKLFEKDTKDAVSNLITDVVDILKGEKQ